MASLECVTINASGRDGKDGQDGFGWANMRRRQNQAPRKPGRDGEHGRSGAPGDYAESGGEGQPIDVLLARVSPVPGQPPQIRIELQHPIFAPLGNQNNTGITSYDGGSIPMSQRAPFPSSICLVSRGGRGGSGGSGGHGEDGGRGSNGEPATRDNEAGRGGCGGDGGDGGWGRPGAPGGRGGDIQIHVAENDKDLLRLVTVQASGGIGGRRGTHGECGRGGQGGTGGMGWSDTSGDSNSKTWPAGHPGINGRDGISPSGEGSTLSEGFEGEPGKCSWIVHSAMEPQGVSFSSCYDVHIRGFTLHPDADNGILEPSDRIVVCDLKLFNAGDMSTPNSSYSPLQIDLLPNAWTAVMYGGNGSNSRMELRDVPSLQAREIRHAPPDLFFYLTDWMRKPEQVGSEPFTCQVPVCLQVSLPSVRRNFESCTQHATVRFPIELLSTACDRSSLVPGQTTRVTVAVRNVSTRSLGQTPRVESTPSTPHRTSSSYPLPESEDDLIDVMADSSDDDDSGEEGQVAVVPQPLVKVDNVSAMTSTTTQRRMWLRVHLIDEHRALEPHLVWLDAQHRPFSEDRMIDLPISCLEAGQECNVEFHLGFRHLPSDPGGAGSAVRCPTYVHATCAIHLFLENPARTTSRCIQRQLVHLRVVEAKRAVQDADVLLVTHLQTQVDEIERWRSWVEDEMHLRLGVYQAESHGGVHLVHMLNHDTFNGGTIVMLLPPPSSDTAANALIHKTCVGDEYAQALVRDCVWPWQIVEACRKRPGLRLLVVTPSTRTLEVAYAQLPQQVARALSPMAVLPRLVVPATRAVRDWPDVESFVTQLAAQRHDDMEFFHDTAEHRIAIQVATYVSQPQTASSSSVWQRIFGTNTTPSGVTKNDTRPVQQRLSDVHAQVVHRLRQVLTHQHPKRRITVLPCANIQDHGLITRAYCPVVFGHDTSAPALLVLDGSIIASPSPVPFASLLATIPFVRKLALLEHQLASTSHLTPYMDRLVDAMLIDLACEMRLWLWARDHQNASGWNQQVGRPDIAQSLRCLDQFVQVWVQRLQTVVQPQRGVLVVRLVATLYQLADAQCFWHDAILPSRRAKTLRAALIQVLEPLCAAATTASTSDLAECIARERQRISDLGSADALVRGFYMRHSLWGDLSPDAPSNIFTYSALESDVYTRVLQQQQSRLDALQRAQQATSA